MKSRLIAVACLFVILLLPMRGQVVGVTVQLDTNTITVGQGTTLRVFAQVLPAYRPLSEQIFSWYVDVLNTNGAAASANYAGLLKPVSDKDPSISSNGFSSGANRLAIYDTLINLPRAGVTNSVELLRIPVIGLVAGQTRFAVRHGTGQPNLAEDFIVAPADGGNLMSGGDYTAAFANLTVVPGAGPVEVTCLSLTHTQLAGTQQRATLTYCPLAGYDHFVEYRDQMAPGPSGWQQASGGPYNSGTYMETNNVAMRYFRIRATLR
jgi:hypothetical protein